MSTRQQKTSDLSRSKRERKNSGAYPNLEFPGDRQGVKVSRDNRVFPGNFSGNIWSSWAPHLKLCLQGASDKLKGALWIPMVYQPCVVVWQTTPKFSGLKQWPFYLLMILWVGWFVGGAGQVCWSCLGPVPGQWGQATSFKMISLLCVVVGAGCRPALSPLMPNSQGGWPLSLGCSGVPG